MIENIKILHLAPDYIFTDIAYKNFESIAPLCNTFFIPSLNKKLNYIKETPVKLINPFSFKNPFFMKSLEKYDFIVLHSLNTFNQEIVAHSSPCLKFVWIGMGHDYYDIIYENHESLYQEQTKDIVKNLTNKENSTDNLLNRLAKNIFYKKIEKKTIVGKINFFAPVLENEYDIVASKFNSNFPAFIAWNYGGTAMIEGKIKHCNLNGNNILVGNSATPSNNHMEVFDFLRTQNLSGKKIICPLSYGNSEYANILKKKCRAFFGDSFLSVDEFMPYESYVNLISSCSNVIMNHHRQQGGGNVLAMLYLGAKVFLNEKNPLYVYYKESGIVIFTIDELYNNPSLLDFHLSEEAIEKNRQIIKARFSEKTILNKTENLIKKVIYSSKSSG
ncbi:4-alpha-L-fucosyltransferase [Methanosarcina siciliae HI350]|uniref:4-alpha-L-fucosyltransferase n=1 Tax=Methanosarcina siciliae HI350 TaxID=1434119 RepID=A0A0E3PER1_9EURY|nr:TDP-N-acetylfucosamine:lipid II N-acetylfucosaminyltransferase [Methanosarcina siciliae]AKB33077.1 4-alpha-L-fucosyltransferase [Methanosarcina siciliae HI350]